MHSCPDCGATAPKEMTGWTAAQPGRRMAHVCKWRWLAWTVVPLDLDAELGA